MNNIRLEPGCYKAISEVTVSLLQSGREIEYVIYKPGEVFKVGYGVNGFYSAATYYPDFGNSMPQYERVH